MKKIRNITWMFAGVVALVLTACSEDFPERTPSPVPVANCMEVYFPNTNKSAFSVEPTVSSVTVTIAREDTASAATIALKKVDKLGVFTIPSTVSFAALQKEATITVSFEGLEYFKQYLLEIQVDAVYTNPYLINANGSTNFLLSVTQSDWADYATGAFTSGFFEESWDQTLQYSEILERYRFPDVWVAGYNYEFEWDGGAELAPYGTTNADGYIVMPSGYVHPSYGMIMTQTDPSIDYTYYTEATKTFVFNMKWTVSAGSFGWTDEVFVMTTVL